MDEQIKQAFDFARDTTKQLITLSTGIIALTVTFSKDVFHNPSGLPLKLLVGSWFSFLISVCLGVWTLLALTGTLEPMPKSPAQNGAGPNPPSIRGSNVTIPSLLQIIAFLAGLALTVWFGVVSVS